MLAVRLIPSLLMRAGTLVKGVGFARHRPAGAPETTVRAHDAQSADELTLLDIDASRERRGPDIATIARAAKGCSTPLTVGGGVGDLESARACMRAGADKLSVNAAALDSPVILDELARIYGAQAVVVGIDVVGGASTPRIYDHRAGRPVAGKDFDGWIKEVVDRGAGEIRLTAVDREGTRAGFDLELLGRAKALSDAPIVIEGGGGTLEHIDAAVRAGADAVAIGTMLTFSDNNLLKIKRYLAQRGHLVRLG